LIIRKRIPIAVVVMGTLLLLPGDGRTQEEAFFADAVDVELVLVDVFVTGNGGAPVLDLTREDFKLLEDGKPVEIEQFSAITGGGSRMSTVTTSLPSGDTYALDDVEMPPAHVVIFIDDLNLGPGYRKRVFDQLQRSLKANLRPQDLVMVASYRGMVETLLPFTTDRQALKKTLMDMANLEAQAVTASLGEDRILQLIEERHRQESQPGGFSSGDPCVDLGFIARTHAEQVHGRVLRATSELATFVKSLAGFPGRKTLLHVSDGIPLIAGLEAYSYAIELCDGSGLNKGVPGAVDTAQMGGNAQYTRWNPTQAWAELTQFNSANDFTELTADANTYQVSIYAVQAVGLGGRQRGQVDRAITSQETATTAWLNSQDPLFMMSEETGGEAILNTNQFEPAFVGMVEETRQGYQLAFTPPKPSDGKLHKLHVEVDQPGVDVRYRRSYRRKTNEERIADGVLSALFHDLQENPLNARLEMAKTASVTRNVTNLTMRVHIPLAGLVMVPDGTIQMGRFTVYVGVKDGHGSIMPVRHKTLPITIATADLERDPEQEYIYEVEIPVRGRDNVVAVAVRDELGGSASYVSERVDLTAKTADSG
jgi:VWFA-related protein